MRVTSRLVLFALLFATGLDAGCAPASRPERSATGPARSARTYTPGYPMAAHVFCAPHPAVEQLYLGTKRPLAQIALVGRYTWLDGNHRLYVTRITDRTTGKQWEYALGTGRDLLEVIPGVYELELAASDTDGTRTMTVTAEPGVTYGVYPEGVKNEGLQVTNQIREKEQWRSIALPYEASLRHSRFFTALGGKRISQSDGKNNLSISVMGFETFYIDHSAGKDIERKMGKADAVQEMDGLTHWTYNAAVYKTEIEKKVQGDVSSNTPARPLTIALGTDGSLKSILE